MWNTQGAVFSVLFLGDLGARHSVASLCGYFIPPSQSVILCVVFELWALWHIMKKRACLPLPVLKNFEPRNNIQWCAWLRYKNKSVLSLWADMLWIAGILILRPVGNIAAAQEFLLTKQTNQLLLCDSASHAKEAHTHKKSQLIVSHFYFGFQCISLTNVGS